MKPLAKAKLLVFDLDGTLIDSCQDIADALNRSLEEVGFSPFPMATIKQFVGNGVRPLVEKAVAAAGCPDRFDDTIENFRAHYDRRVLVHTRLYDGVTETLEALRDRYRLALVTNKPERFTNPIVAGLGLHRYFGDAVISGDTLTVSKPAPDALFAFMERHDATPARTVMIGDSAVDVMTGKNAGAATVGVTYGFRGAEELVDAGVDIMIDAMPELLGHLDGPDKEEK